LETFPGKKIDEYFARSPNKFIRQEVKVPIVKAGARTIKHFYNRN
jgi:hypothetical protein